MVPQMKESLRKDSPLEWGIVEMPDSFLSGNLKSRRAIGRN